MEEKKNNNMNKIVSIVVVAVVIIVAVVICVVLFAAGIGIGLGIPSIKKSIDKQWRKCYCIKGVKCICIFSSAGRAGDF